jgi:uncharacterized protein YgiM (DUF1202 family)
MITMSAWREATMRPLRLFLFVLSLSCAAIAAAEDFPYSAYIAADKTEVVAGPGHRFYATDRLARGMKVEIYREEASGWLAIRPPEGSFSWAPADFVERLEDEKLGRVKESTGAWVGTSVEHVTEHHQQVTLKAGELVHIIDEKTVAGKEGTERTWLKIAPPAGEYRWVHLRDVVRQKPEEAEAAPLAEASDIEDGYTLTPALSQRKREKTKYDRWVEPAQFQSTKASGDAKTLSPDGFVPRKRRDNETSVAPGVDSGARFATAVPRTALTTPINNELSRTGLRGDELSRQLDEIEIDLSLMLAKDRSQWDLAAIRRRVETLVEGGADPVSRGRARLVLEKIKQFEDAFGTGGRGSAVVGADKSLPASTSLADPRYDAQGWLKPVVSKKSDKPVAPFAVVDADGKPVCFISPSPGLNLNRYLNKQVGLYGRRGYLEELKKPHLVAERVIELDSKLR